MKTAKTILLIVLASTMLYCKANYWTQKADYPGRKLIYHFSFSINDKGYFGCGSKYDSIGTDYNDFWMYDPAANTWTQKADFSGGVRHFAAGFVVHNKGYAGLGVNSSGSLHDLWEYDPVMNSWSQKMSAPTLAVNQASFATSNYGYIINDAGNLFQYDPLNDTWQQKTSCPISRIQYLSFAIGDTGYVGMGYDAGVSSLSTLFYQYIEQTDSWNPIAPFPGNGRYTGVCFQISSKGYLGMGFGDDWPIYYNDFWQYDPTTNNWTQAAAYSGVPRANYFYFSTSTKGYAGVGSEQLTNPNLYFNDLWEYNPGSLSGIAYSEPSHDFGFTISPNICTSFCKINFWSLKSKNILLIISDLNGKVILEKYYYNFNYSFSENIPISNLATGIYQISVSSGTNYVSRKFVKA
jgi:N-acetylneuraminic acid mutarotase